MTHCHVATLGELFSVHTRAASSIVWPNGDDADDDNRRSRLVSQSRGLRKARDG